MTAKHKVVTSLSFFFFMYMVIKILKVILETDNQTNAHAFPWIMQPCIDL